MEALTTSLLQRRPWTIGILLGSVVMAGAWIVGLAPLLSDSYGEKTASVRAMLGAAAVGYVVAIAMTVARPTRRAGQGMLVGLTASLPVAFAGLVAANLGIFGWW